ncbi:MAG: sterol carrier family protein [Microbacteriaceae bacterium]
MAKKIPIGLWQAALKTYLGDNTSRDELATAVRGLLQNLAERYPGKTVEVRVPPFGAVQCMGGPEHTRGTPANVVELRPEVFLDLALGRGAWDVLQSEGRISATGARSNLAELFPLLSAAEIERIQSQYQAE